MTSRTGLLLYVPLLLALAAVVWLVLADPDTMTGSGTLERDQDTGEPIDLLDGGATRLTGSSDALSPEQLAARRAEAEAAAQAPAFPRAEGVFGRVMDARERPIANASVSLAVTTPYRRWGAPDEDPFATAETNELGEFLVGPAPTGPLRLRAEADGYAPSVKDVRRRGYRMDVILDVGGELEIAVKQTDGAAIEGAQVLYTVGQVVTERATDPAGVAAFPGVPTGTGRLHVVAEGFAAAIQGDLAVAPGRTERHTVVLGPPLEVDGRVIRAQGERPIRGAEVTLRYPNMPWIDPTGPLLTDVDGAFQAALPLPTGQTFEAEVRGEGFAPMRTSTRSTDAGNGRMRLELRVEEPGGGVEGVVRDQRDHPVAGASVSYVTERADQETPSATSGHDGHFVLAPPAWSSRRGSRVQVIARTASGGVGVARARLPQEGEAADPCTVRVSGAGTVTGRVTDVAGEPVEGALVSLRVDYRASVERNPGPTGRNPYARFGILTNPRYVTLDAITDESGSFHMSPVPSASYRVTATWGLDTTSPDKVVVVDAGATATQDVVLGEGGTIEGAVTDEEGSPVAGAYVTAWPEARRGQRRGSQASARSQSDGSFVLHGVASGLYGLRARAAGYQSKTVTGIASGATGTELTLLSLGWIDGVVTMNGMPFQGTFTVTARKATQDGGDGPRVPGWFGGGRGNTFNTDDGTFVLRNLSGGEYDVSAATPDGQISPTPVRVRVAEGSGSEVTLALHGGGTLKGRLVSDTTEAPLAGASISVSAVPGDTDPPASTGHARTDADGHFTVRGLASGRYAVHVWPPSGISFTTVLEVRAGEVQDITLRELRTGSVRIVVRDENGAPVAGVTPQIRAESGTQVWPNQSAYRKAGLEVPQGGMRTLIQTDASGLNLRHLVPPGRYEITLRGAGREIRESVWIRVASGQETSAELIAQPREATSPR